jgi:hypothetical protein
MSSLPDPWIMGSYPAEIGGFSLEQKSSRRDFKL